MSKILHRPITQHITFLLFMFWYIYTFHNIMLTLIQLHGVPRTRRKLGQWSNLKLVAGSINPVFAFQAKLYARLFLIASILHCKMYNICSIYTQQYIRPHLQLEVTGGDGIARLYCSDVSPITHVSNKCSARPTGWDHQPKMKFLGACSCGVDFRYMRGWPGYRELVFESYIIC